MVLAFKTRLLLTAPNHILATEPVIGASVCACRPRLSGINRSEGGQGGSRKVPVQGEGVPWGA